MLIRSVTEWLKAIVHFAHGFVEPGSGKDLARQFVSAQWQLGLELRLPALHTHLGTLLNLTILTTWRVVLQMFLQAAGVSSQDGGLLVWHCLPPEWAVLGRSCEASYKRASEVPECQ